MTVIACKITKGLIEIASDTQSTWGHNKYDKQNQSDKQLHCYGKLFKVNGMIIGGSGTTSHIAMMQIFCKTHKPKDATRDSVLDWLIEFTEWVKKKSDIAAKDLSLHGIMVYENTVFRFFDWVEVEVIDGFTAVGSGMFLALGALEAGAEVKAVIKVAIKYDLYCGGTVKYMSVKKKERSNKLKASLRSGR